MASRVVVVGGGAAGFFGALRAAELGARVVVLEAGSEPLAKVAISGGGRCNVTNAERDLARFSQQYPRGGKEMRQALSRFGPRETEKWFESRGVALKTEPDGRVFPVSDSSASIVDALLDEARKLRVDVRARAPAASLARDGAAWRVALRDGAFLEADRVLVASGSSPTGLALATSLGHAIAPPVPALFSLVVKDARLDGLAGVSVPHARATLECEGLKRPVTKEGPLLVTHQGLSAHAILRLSSWSARELAAARYRAIVTIDFVPEGTEAGFLAAADAMRAEHGRATVAAHPLADGIPRRLWERLAEWSGIASGTRWSEAPRAGLAKLAAELKRGRYESSGRGDFREEIVTCGGVDRREVDWRTMESRIAPGVHVAGEALDVDALTGGYNLQAAWTTGWLAGTAMGAP